MPRKDDTHPALPRSVNLIVATGQRKVNRLAEYIAWANRAAPKVQPQRRPVAVRSEMDFSPGKNIGMKCGTRAIFKILSIHQNSISRGLPGQPPYE